MRMCVVWGWLYTTRALRGLFWCTRKSRGDPLFPLYAQEYAGGLAGVRERVYCVSSHLGGGGGGGSKEPAPLQLFGCTQVSATLCSCRG